MTANRVNLMIVNGTVLTMDHELRQIRSGTVAIKGDTIAAVGPSDNFKEWTADRVIDAREGIIMPGLINTHTHAAMTLLRGLADDMPLMTWLHDHIFPAEAKLDADKVYWGSLLACAEMILSGTTCFCDMYLFEDSVAQAAKNAGIRAVVGEVLFDFPSPNYGPIEKGFEYTESLILKWKDDPLITIAVEPHSPYLCSSELLIRAAELAHQYRIPLKIHLSETEAEVDSIRNKYERTPIEQLAHIGVLAPNLIACHCVAVSDNDIALLHKFDVKVTHNPESNMKLASGIAPIKKFLDKGICVGLGTDGCASNNNLDMFLEMDSAAKLHKVASFDPTSMDAPTVLKMSTQNGARVLGMGDMTGSIASGKKADIIVVDTRKPHLVPMYNPMSHMVYSANGSDVVHSVINGRIVMENRQLLTMDVNEIIQKINELAKDFA